MRGKKFYHTPMTKIARNRRKKNKSFFSFLRVLSVFVGHIGHTKSMNTLPIIVATNPIIAIAFLVITVIWVILGLIDELVNFVRRVVVKRSQVANRCKGITKQGTQCLNTIDCHYHNNK